MKIKSKVKEKSISDSKLGIKNTKKYKIRRGLTLFKGLSEQMFHGEPIAHGNSCLGFFVQIAKTTHPTKLNLADCKICRFLFRLTHDILQYPLGFYLQEFFHFF